ncbi:MFS transporter [Tenuibacillus multivorans]|uniref:Predicted arabinose efflux permease, MFS family n=1 Tax=Tenuibacillus multivorans TaxID=237069 RepID=A0A1H0FIS3_9BACI|nr:MFS transporter [Tenuibacillus multivorans]GEL77684.1 MFS transporter [Tenuibacillus multivorans]SDN94577.1 Predicted arabinose efflux permease, MFS family [Tenuibacillus multivorans]
MTATSIWKNNTFMRLFYSYSISMFGRWFDMVAIMILFSYIWEANPIIIALIPVAYALPHAFLSQFAGILADRFNKVKLMLTADIATVILTLTLLTAPNPWIAISIILLRAIFTVIHFPAQQSLIKHVVKKELIMKAVSLNGSVDQLTKIIGPFIGGALASAFTPHLSLLINAVAYFISALILLSVLKQGQKETTTDTHKKEKVPFWQSWKEGWIVVLQSKIIIVSILFSLISFTGVQMVDAQIAVLLREIAPTRPELVGWIMASSGAGALVIIWFLNRMDQLSSYGLILGGSVFLIGAGFGGVGFLYVGVPSIIPVILGFIAGLGVGLFSIGINYILQKETSEANIGRVSGIFSSITSLMILFAPLIGGMLVNWFDTSTVYQMIGIVLTSIGLIGIVLRKVLWGGKITSNKQQTA